MIRRARVVPFAAVLTSAAVLGPALLAPAASAGPAATRLPADSVAITVDSVDPIVLPTTTKPRPFTVSLSLTNRGSTDLAGVTVEGERGEPKANQAALDDAMTHVAAPTGHVVAIAPTKPVKVDLAVGETRQVVFTSTTSTLDTGGLCNCSEGAVYPLFFSAHVGGPGGVDQSIGLGSTFVSSFFRAPQPVRVAWVWPLIDQPHLLDDTPVGTTGPVFVDDFLAAAVGTGGRLDRALTVLEHVTAAAPEVPLTVVLDPELLFELQLMATGPYSVRTSATRSVPGTGKAIAAQWLDRLRRLLDTSPQIQVQLTPYADPDVESVHAAGDRWSATLPTAIHARVDAALGGHPTASTLTWPARAVLSRGTLDALVDDGTSTVLLNSSAIRPGVAQDAVRPGLARLSAHGQDVAVGILDPKLEKYVDAAATLGGAGAAALPALISELAIRAAQEPTAQHVAVLAPDRWVNPSVDDAVRAIEESSRSLVAQPISLSDAVAGELLPNGRSHLAGVPAALRSLPTESIQAAEEARGDVPALRALFTPRQPQQMDPQAQALLTALPLEAQRAVASAWGREGNGGPATNFAAQLTDALDTLTHGISIVTPSAGSYTLASDNSPLPITVHNDLPYQVTVVVRVTAVNAQPGFTAKPMTEVVEAHQKATVHLPTNVERTGRIRVIAALYTPDGVHQIGDAVDMTVRSTALGVVGIVITIAAGAVLLLALLVRFGRRLVTRYRPAPDPVVVEPLRPVERTP